MISARHRTRFASAHAKRQGLNSTPSVLTLAAERLWWAPKGRWRLFPKALKTNILSLHLGVAPRAIHLTFQPKSKQPLLARPKPITLLRADSCLPRTPI